MFVSKRKIFELKQVFKDVFESLDSVIEHVKTFNEEKSTDIEKDLMFCCAFQDEDIQELKEMTEYLIETDNIESAISFISVVNFELLSNYFVSLAEKIHEYEEKSNTELECVFSEIALSNKDVFLELYILKDWIKEKQGRSTVKQETPVTKRGRPTGNITSKMIEDEDGRKLNKIQSLMKGKRGKDAALIILVAIKKGWMNKPTFTEVENAFGCIGTQQGFSNYLNEKKFTDEEINGAMSSLKI